MRILEIVQVHLCKRFSFFFFNLTTSVTNISHYVDDGNCRIYCTLHANKGISIGDRMTHGSTGDCRGYRARYFNSWFLGMRRVPTWWMAWHRRADFRPFLIGRIRTNSVVRPRLSSADPPSWCQALSRSTCIRMLQDWKRWTVRSDRGIRSIFKYHPA